jgi:predicted dehydrogenase
MAADKVRIGIVGGGFGAAFQWHLDPNCTVEAVCDLRPDRRQHLMTVYGCEKTHDSLEELIRHEAINAVGVFTGAPDHVRHSVAVMNAGKHCICAVPAAITLEECEELIEAKERNGVRYMMAETSYYRWPTILMRDMYADGEFGEVLYSEVEYYHPLYDGTPERQHYWWDPQGNPTWRHGYPPLLYPTHSTGFLVGVTRERLVAVSAMGYAPPDDPVLAGGRNQYANAFSCESALFATDRGNICRCNVMFGINAHGERAQWFGERVSAFMANSGGQPFVVKREGESDVTQLPDYWQRLPEPMRGAGGHGNSHPFLTHEFVSALVEDRDPAIDVYESVAMTAPGIVAHESALRGGEHLKVPSFDRPRE